MEDRDVMKGLWVWRVNELFGTMVSDVVLEGVGLTTALEKVGLCRSQREGITNLALQDFLELAIGNFAAVLDGHI
eukprot:1099780-Rhodomonas_salina.1